MPITSIAGYACKGKGLPLEKWSYEPAPLRSNDVTIKISHCGVCASDIHTLDSGWGQTPYPIIVGHEISGSIIEVGADVKKFKVGDRVAVGCQCDACHKCSQCITGVENHCVERTMTYSGTNYAGKPTHGGYAEAIRLSTEFVFALPDSIPSDVAGPLMCAGVTVFAPLQRHMTPGCKVGVIGIGGLGHMALQFAKALGSVEVTAITSTARKQADSLALGASKVLESSNPEQMAAAAKTIDLIICTTNFPKMQLEPYLSLLKVGGKLVVLGLPENPISVNLAALILSQTSIVGSLIGSPLEIEQMLEFAGRFKIFPWIEKVPMARVNEAIAKVHSNDVRYRFVLEN